MEMALIQHVSDDILIVKHAKDPVSSIVFIHVMMVGTLD